MSRMKLYGKPPLAKSPIRLRPRRSLRSNSTSLETPLAFSKTQGPTRYWDKEEEEVHELPPEYKSMSCELLELAEMVKQEFGNNGVENIGFVNSSPLFERGRFYDIYSARRNERLKRKKIESGGIRKPAYEEYLGVNVEASKRSDSKKFASARKSMTCVYSSVDKREQTRYSLRSSSSSSSSFKESKKLPVDESSGYSLKLDKPGMLVESARKLGARRVIRV